MLKSSRRKSTRRDIFGKKRASTIREHGVLVASSLRMRHTTQPLAGLPHQPFQWRCQRGRTTAAAAASCLQLPDLLDERPAFLEHLLIGADVTAGNGDGEGMPRDAEIPPQPITPRICMHQADLLQDAKRQLQLYIVVSFMAGECQGQGTQRREPRQRHQRLCAVPCEPGLSRRLRITEPDEFERLPIESRRSALAGASVH